jgi:diguanylate cyclase (GGDEF)-like protein
MRHGSHPTIGVLAGWQAYQEAKPDRFIEAVYKGIRQAARMRDCNLLLACGMVTHNNVDWNKRTTAWPERYDGADFVPVGPWNTDGLIVIPPLWSQNRWDYLQRLKTQGFSVVFQGFDDYGPSVVVDNEGGIRQALAHLVEHGHRNIAFIAGDDNERGDSPARLRAYQRFMDEHGLVNDPRLVAYGNHAFSGGAHAIRRILDSGVGFSAVVASNDTSAAGAMSVLKQQGLRIPDDIAIIGFDNQPVSISQVPALSTIEYPFEEAGHLLVDLLLTYIQTGAKAPQKRVVATRLIMRQTCGCLTEHMPATPATAGAQSAATPQQDITALLERNVKTLTPENVQTLCTQLSEAFQTSLRTQAVHTFRGALLKLVTVLEDADEDVTVWQHVISAQRDQALIEGGGTPLAGRLAEDMFHLARAVLAESARRQDLRHQVHRDTEENTLNHLMARFLTTVRQEEIIQHMLESLPALNIRHATVSLFDASLSEKGADAWATLHVSREEGAPVEQVRFQSRSFPLPGLYAGDTRLSLALLPLVHQNEQLGFVAFDAANLEPCGALVRQLASALVNARLHAQVLELSLTDSLTGLHNRRYFDLFLDNETGRSRRYERDMALLMLDMDSFKGYNDTYGHPAGDVALQEVAACITAGRRGSDIGVRYGGEEFAVILPETNLDGALIVAEEIRSRVAALSNLKRHITVSIGVATLEAADTPAHLIDKADDALYAAKRSGRNRICTYTDRGLNKVECLSAEFTRLT